MNTLLQSSGAIPPRRHPPVSGPPLDYVALPDAFRLPPAMNLGSTSGIAINSRGHVFVLSRAPLPISEFDADGNFVRGFGAGLFERPHGLRIDAEDNLWTTDVASHLVFKFDPEGRMRMVLGVKGHKGEWHPYGHLPLFAEPSDVIIGRDGAIFVSQGHGKAESRILKFDRDGNYLSAFGRTGTGPGEFDIPHAMAIDAAGLLYVADRNNERIQVFEQDGTYVRESRHVGTPCGICITPAQDLFLANGHSGQIIRLDLQGNVLGVMSQQGKAVGQFGEAHFIAVSPRDEIYVADTLNWRVQKFIRAGSRHPD